MSNVLAVQSLGGNKQEGRRFRQVSAESFKRFRTESIVILLYNQFYSLSLMLGQVMFFIVMAGSVIEGTFTAGDYLSFRTTSSSYTRLLAHGATCTRNGRGTLRVCAGYFS